MVLFLTAPPEIFGPGSLAHSYLDDGDGGNIKFLCCFLREEPGVSALVETGMAEKWPAPRNSNDDSLVNELQIGIQPEEALR